MSPAAKILGGAAVATPVKGILKSAKKSSNIPTHNLGGGEDGTKAVPLVGEVAAATAAAEKVVVAAVTVARVAAAAVATEAAAVAAAVTAVTATLEMAMQVAEKKFQARCQGIRAAVGEKQNNLYKDEPSMESLLFIRQPTHGHHPQRGGKRVQHIAKGNNGLELGEAHGDTILDDAR